MSTKQNKNTSATKISVTTKQESLFVKRNLEQLNKTEKDIQREQVIIFVEDAVIECNTAIGLFKTRDIPTLKTELERAEVKLDRANKTYEESRFKVSTSFEAYMSTRNKALMDVDMIESEIDVIKSKINTAEAKLKAYEEVLADLKA